LFPSASLLISRIAPGCLCCTGNLVLRVTLNRLLRESPRRLFIGVARGEHLDQLRSWLESAPYDQLLELAPILHS
jgi:G3E family GTPase